MNVAVSLAQLLLVAVFSLSGVAKLFDRSGTRETVLAFGLPGRIAGPVAVFLPIVEVAIAAALIIPISARRGAAAAFVLLAVFCAAIVRSLMRGSAPECHCFGALSRSTVGPGTLVRNTILAAIAVLAAFGAGTSRSGALAWYSEIPSDRRATVMTIVVLGSAVIALASLCWQLLRQNGRLLMQLDEGGALPASPARRVTAPPLEIGEPAPAFSGHDLDGEFVSIERLLAPQTPVALLFTDPHCGACRPMLEEAARVQAEYADVLTVAIVGRGDGPALRERAHDLGLQRVIHDPDDNYFTAFRILGSPSALIVGTDGRIATAAVAGPAAVQLLADAGREAAQAVLAEPARR